MDSTTCRTITPYVFRHYAEIVKERPETSLFVVGDGPAREKYRDLVEARGWPDLHLAGYVRGAV